MEDKSILSMGQGQAMPYISLFDSSGSPILDSVTKKPIGMFVENFEYSYSEEDDDELEIVFKSDNPDLIDIPELRDKMTILVQWGYIFPDGKVLSSPIRKVIKRDDELDTDQSNFKITLKCTDGLSLIKTQPVDRFNESFEEWVKYNLRGMDMVKFIRYKTNSTMNIGSSKFTKKIGEYVE